MMFKVFLLILCFSFSKVSFAFDFEKINLETFKQIHDIPKPEISKEIKLAKWTVMYFINGKNDLESSAVMDINQLELVGSGDDVKIVVEMGRMKGQEGDDVSQGNWTGVRRYLIEKDNDLSAIKSKVLDYMGDKDMGSWKELANFIRWSKKNFPAEKYALIMWDHGNGWKPVDEANSGEFMNKGFSLDEQTGNEISVPQMTWALKEAGGVDFIMLDGCNMAMAEVAYELKGFAKVLTASEETEPAVVVRYAQFLSSLSAKPDMGAEEFAYQTVKTYADFFNAGGSNEGAYATQSVFNLSKMDLFAQKLNRWVYFAFGEDKQILTKSFKDSKMFGEEPEFRDLCDFLILAARNSQNENFKQETFSLIKFIKEELIIVNWAQDNLSHGVSVYAPLKYDKLYDNLMFSKDTLWDDFVKSLIK